ncbi:hypothetical protein C5167_043415 [Papaver somniferum]|uniref:Uncharacterized protein n=1 Tax=Papaver somniferum TaxID=3469 RepID=A0A4Y7L848_PAPSO|nr:hypothetical protein C5167_043415 [Papaver somniferum]
MVIDSRSSQTPKPHSGVVKANANPSPVVQVSTIVCENCEGNGKNSNKIRCLVGIGCSTILCVPGVRLRLSGFRRFKAGGLGWLCSSGRIGDVCVRKGAN